MSPIDNLPPPPDNRMSAAEVRRRMAEIELAKMQEAEEKKRRLEAQQAAQFKEFLEGEITEEELERIRFRIKVALENGQMEIEVLRFPCANLSDKGRAINNFDPNWPETLRGKAASYYQLFKMRGEPLGYKMSARVLNYPDGKPGDVGLFLSWG
jgi:hypothetical protein